MTVKSSQDKIAKLKEQIKAEEKKLSEKRVKLIAKSGILDIEITEDILIKELGEIVKKYK